MTVYPKQKTGEALGIAMLAASMLVLAALATYHPLDPSLNVSSPATNYANQIGRFGAWIADVLFQGFGLPAFLLPLALLRAGYRKLRGRAAPHRALRLLGAATGLVFLCAGCFLAEPWLWFELEFAAGGALGQLAGGLLLSVFNPLGSALVVATALLLALVLSTRFSVETLLGWFAGLRWPSPSRFGESWARWKKGRHDKRELRRKNADDVITQPPPARPSQSQPAVASERTLPIDAEPARQPAPTLNWDPLVKSLADRRPDSAAELRTGPQRDAERPYLLPSLNFLTMPEGDLLVDEEELIARAEQLTSKYAEFGVLGRVLQIHPGPVVTTFEFKPDPGVKYSRMTALVDDLCLAMKAESIRIDRIPGKNTVGIEVPNTSRQTILLREILGSGAFQQSESLLSLGLGKLINGNTYVSDLGRMPHLLIAGATGAGKSVAINCVICSILYKASPREVKFILIDPKRLELGLYADIPHLLTPIVTDPKQAANALGWAVREMEQRYKTLAQFGVRNLAQFNKLAAERKLREDPEEEPFEPLPIIVVVVDELADLMMTAGKEVEASLTRLAQMARAIGIHLILATQRPSVDVITGLIKANFPSRVSFRVSSKIDSRTVLDANGAEQLLGQGDMLFLSPRTSRPIRIHGGFITEKEIARIVDHLKEQAAPDYREEVLEGDGDSGESALVDFEDLEDPLYDEAARFVVETGKASTSLLQRRLRVGYGRAARLLDMMEHEGLISPPDGSRAREVLVPVNHFDEIDSGGG